MEISSREKNQRKNPKGRRKNSKKPSPNNKKSKRTVVRAFDTARAEMGSEQVARRDSEVRNWGAKHTRSCPG